ncbi:MAG: Uma2 family endonuclease [Cyanobacteria bacterium P01_A01_bin.105]
MPPLILDVQPLSLNTDQFYALAQANRNLRLERSAQGSLVIMPPTGWGTGNRNLKIAQRLANWADADGTGLGFDSSTGFILPNGAIRSPDAAWVQQARLLALNPDPDKFLPLCPDFVVELRSASDDLAGLQIKMQEYLDNGLRLGWLLNPQGQSAEIYRDGQIVEVLSKPTSLSGEGILPGFTLSLSGIF